MQSTLALCPICGHILTDIDRALWQCPICRCILSNAPTDPKEVEAIRMTLYQKPPPKPRKRKNR